MLKKQPSPIKIEGLHLKLGITEEELNKLVTDSESQGLIKANRKQIRQIEIAAEGIKNLQEGFPEERLLKDLKEAGKISVSKIKDSIGLSWAKKNGWVRILEGAVTINNEANPSNYKQREVLEKIRQNAAKGAEDLINTELDIIKELEKRKAWKQ